MHFLALINHHNSWDHRLFQAEFAYNRSTNRSIRFSLFNVIYGYNPSAVGTFLCGLWLRTLDFLYIGEYNKLVVRKIGLLEIVKKINPNAYR
jgi:hypothetical protein